MTRPKRLEVRGLNVRLDTSTSPLSAVTDAELVMYPDEVTALVGESGCGKSVFAQTLFGLLPPTARITGNVQFDGQELASLNERHHNHIRGRGMCMIFQDALRALNPFLTLGTQLEEVLTFAAVSSRPTIIKVRAHVCSVLRQLDFAEPERVMRSFAHELSGGMRQRVVIAMTLLAKPRLIVADEPTTALDTTVQAHVLEALLQVKRETGAAMLFITHNLGAAAAVADKVCVMYAGRFIEVAAKTEFFRSPRHPYSRALIDATPTLSEDLTRPLFVLQGQSPDLRDLPAGCAFAPRCARKQKQCESFVPALVAHAPHAGQVACWFPLTPQASSEEVKAP